jgi:hypothetical protein
MFSKSKIMLERKIIGIKNNPIYQELKNYYGRSTIFSALGIERNENRHSAFLCWLLDPKSDHQLDVEPLKKFLALYAVENNNIDIELRTAFITGRYDIESVEIDKEVTLGRFCENDAELMLDKKQRRLDIWSEFSVFLPDNNVGRKIVLVIENKIYSKEGSKEVIKEGIIEKVYQTNVYHDCLTKYYNDETLLEVFLTPDTAEKANCQQFLHITYQQVLDNVLLPLTTLITSEHAEHFINDYIRNLGTPALNDEDSEKKVKTYSILATSAKERNLLQRLLDTEEMKPVLKMSLIAVYGDQAKTVVGKEEMKKNENMQPYEIALLTEFWNDNTDVFKAMLYNLDIFEDKKAVEKIFKESNRDTTKYLVEKKCEDKWVIADPVFNRPLAKGRAACVFFAQWLDMHKSEFTLDEVREAFPISINKYYENSKWEFHDTLIFGGNSDSFIINKAGKKIKLCEDKWDFYPITDGRNSKCGWGYLKDGNYALMPKMWRKEDFQRLLEHIETKSQLFEGLRIRQV